MNKRKTGGYYETLVEQHLAAQGFEIVAKNFRGRFGEIDIIARDGEYLAFIEVKYRSTNSSGYPEEAVSASKQKTILKTAKYFLTKNGISPDTSIRFDVAAVYPDYTIRYYKNAFTG